MNLNPNQPDRIMDPQMARTEAGRILLEADLVLKKDSVGWMNANTAFGKAFWDELEAIYGRPRARQLHHDADLDRARAGHRPGDR